MNLENLTKEQQLMKLRNWLRYCESSKLKDKRRGEEGYFDWDSSIQKTRDKIASLMASIF